ncbi:MAG: VapC toxin family PIN domain ribonuclease [Anaerolineae bacterium]|nr:VapC toxin family PIN domain ribonuclease [Anaerolineae bacterium]
MPGKVFVDTNVLLRATIAAFPDHGIVKPFLDGFITQGDELWISGQVVREYFNQTTRPQAFMKPMNAAQIEAQYAKLRVVFSIATETEAVVEQFVRLLQTHPTGGKQVHDANLVATMLVYGIDTLLTINVKDLERFHDRITLISPGTAP